MDKLNIFLDVVDDPNSLTTGHVRILVKLVILAIAVLVFIYLRNKKKNSG